MTTVSGHRSATVSGHRSRNSAVGGDPAALAREAQAARASFLRFVYLWNVEQRRGTPELHVRVADWLERRWKGTDTRLALMIFRDAGKSTLVGLYCAWILANHPDKRILVLAAEHGLACRMTRNVRKIIEAHPLCRHLKPNKREEWAADQLTVKRNAHHRDPSLLARGIMGNITGARADVIVCDDVEVPNTCDTPGKREDLRNRLAELNFILVPGGLQLFVGTPHSYYSIYAEEARLDAGEERPFLHGYNRLRIPLVDERGESAWPDRFTPAVVEEMRQASGPARFKSQMLLQPVHSQEARLDPDLLKRYDAALVAEGTTGRRRYRFEPVLEGSPTVVSSCCWWDPAFGRPGSGDGSVVALVLLDSEGRYRLHDLEYLEFSPALLERQDAATQLCRQAIAFAAANGQDGLTVETNGIGKFVPSLLRREVARAGTGLRVREHHSSRNKDQRILDAFDPVLAAGHLLVSAKVASSPFAAEMRDWKPGGRSRDDALDAVAACIHAQPVRLNRAAASALSPPGGFKAISDFGV